MSETAGTTRDSVDSMVTWPDLGQVRFVDTAGMRRGQSVRGVEYYSFLRASEAIDRAHVAVLVIDASAGFTAEDKRIARRVMEAGRAFLVAANKWDLVEEKDRTFKHLGPEIVPFANASAIRTSATRGQGIHRLPPLLIDLHRRWSARTPDGTGQSDHPASATGTPDAPCVGEPPLRGAGRDGSAHLRDLRGSARAGGHVPAVPGEPAPPGARPVGGPGPPPIQGAEGRRRPRAVGCGSTGRGAAWLARLTGGQKVAGSNPAGPTDESDRQGAVVVACPHGPERHLCRPDRSDPGLRRPHHRSRHDDRWSGPLRDRRRHGLGRRHDRPPDRTGVRCRQDPRPGGRPARDRRRADRSGAAWDLPAVGGGSDPRPGPDRPRGRARSPLSEAMCGSRSGGSASWPPSH